MAICGLIVLAYYSSRCHLQEIDHSIKAVNHYALNNNEPCHSFWIIPDRCESPIRGHFDRIYEKGNWNGGDSLRKPSDFYSDAAWPRNESLINSASGSGSALGYATETSLKIIKDTITKYNVKYMADIPCGDVNWIFDSFETDALPLYVGLDITGAVIKLNNERFAHHRNKQFHFWDATTCALPRFQYENGDKQAFDLVHVRDVIQHMTLDQGVQFFCNVFNGGPKVLITTTYETASENENISEGGWYMNNLLLEPFSFPKTHCILTHPKIENDFTCVYNLTEDW
eukprot:CAMPEP_0172322658 /NCGR_PEP_ID=MMETSP1058-20130122/46515_1 /TAXON_ID=83371 /ORGANISM="Detonula confervacea, Strain CCMP 353" /LENGTH=284 /DNA_ID=CAMNT_0013038461 /DNA_START=234 /DNA_END=1085 /DNA_ORIENTATION=-